jgi:hypothetical protein
VKLIVAPDVADVGDEIVNVAAGPGPTLKLPVLVNVLVVVSVAEMVCVPIVFRVTVVWPTPLANFKVPGFTNFGSELLKMTVPL